MASPFLTSIQAGDFGAPGFLREAERLSQRFGLGRALNGPERNNFQLLTYRYESELTEMQRLLRGSASYFADEWADAILPEQFTPARFSLDLLLTLAVKGVLETDLAFLAETLEGNPELPRCERALQSLPAPIIGNYLEFLRDFAPYLKADEIDLAQRLLLQPESAHCPETVSRFVADIMPCFQVHFRTARIPIAMDDIRWPYWFNLYLGHLHGAEGLPPQYLATPFSEVVRNVPPVIWDEAKCDQPRPWRLGIGSAGFFALAAGEGARSVCRSVGLPRSAWRSLVNLGASFQLSDLQDPAVYVWALGLGTSLPLAHALDGFVPGDRFSSWAPIVQQLSRLQNVNWELQEGQEILGYVYHMLRDQPDFSINVRHQEAFISATRAYYDRIAVTRARIQQGREDTAEADRNDRRQQQVLAAQIEQRRRMQLERYYRQSSWEPDSLRCVNGKSQQLRFVELTNGWQLYLEGQAMGHCVADYTQSCLRGEFSIWSLRLSEGQGNRSIVTIRVRKGPNPRIMEARARFNRNPDLRYQGMINGWATFNRMKPFF